MRFLVSQRLRDEIREARDISDVQRIVTVNEDLMTGNLWAHALHRLSKLNLQHTPAHVANMHHVFTFVESSLVLCMDEGELGDGPLSKALWACMRMGRPKSSVFAHAYDWYLKNAREVGLEAGISALRAFLEAGHYDRTLF